MGMHYLPTNIDFEASALNAAKDDYVRGKLEVDELEVAVGKILDGTDRHYTSPFEPLAVEWR